MSEFTINCPFPLDDDKFLRRECPFCCREFKVLLEESELTDLVQNIVNSFMLETNKETPNSDESSSSKEESICPYCGQQASKDSWWTQEQLAYLRVVGQNIMAKQINEHLIRPLKRNFGSPTSSGFISIQFTGNEMEQQEPWISPEVNDMEVFELPCCQRKIKILEDWNKRTHCFFCGFPHKLPNIETKIE